MNESTPVGSASTPVKAQHSRRNGGRQAGDLNHLLGFTLPERTPPPSIGPRRSARKAGGHSSLFLKQRFVHQFRVILRPDKIYAQHFADPDIHFNWEDILQVIVPTTSALASASTSTFDQGVGLDGDKGVVQCPICLSKPTAARMTKCGHVYCFPCLLHYLALSEGTKWRKCPVCWDPIYPKDLKPVKWHDPVAESTLADVSPSLQIFEDHHHHHHQQTPFEARLPTEPLKMRLIRRPQLTTLALPRSSTWPSEAVPPLRVPWHFTPDAFGFAKFMLGAPDYLKGELEGDLRELEKEIATLRRWGKKGGTDEELGIVFVHSAMGQVKEQMEEVALFKSHSVMTARKAALRELQAVQDRVGRHALAPVLPLFSETSSSEVEEEVEAATEAPPMEYLATLREGTLLSSSAPAFTPSSSSLPSSNTSTNTSTSTSTSIPTKSRPPRKNVNPPSPADESTYLFYQAASGQNIFLQPLDIRILKSHFGSYEALPDTIQVLVEGSDEGSMNDELRRRCRWLSHLPTGADVVFIEADLSRVVSSASVEPFLTALKQRRNKRRDKARREDKAKAKSEEREEKKRPVYTTSAEYDADAYSVPLPLPFAGFNTSFAPPLPTTTGFSTSIESAHSNSGSRTVWGTRAVAAAQTTTTSSREADDDYDDRWADFEDGLESGRGGGGRRGASSGSNAGSGNGAENNARTTGKKKKTKVVINLTAGAGGRSR